MRTYAFFFLKVLGFGGKENSIFFSSCLGKRLMIEKIKKFSFT